MRVTRVDVHPDGVLQIYLVWRVHRSQRVSGEDGVGGSIEAVFCEEGHGILVEARESHVNLMESRRDPGNVTEWIR